MNIYKYRDNREIEEIECTKDVNSHKIDFGICFDVDGVLARGTIALAPSVKMIQRLKDPTGNIKVPIVFVTNALNVNQDKANQIGDWLGIQVSPEQMVQAHGPLEVFYEYHDKFCLIIGQGKIFQIAKECGFHNFCTVEEIAEAYPLLDIVDHDNRVKIAQFGYKEKEFPRIEAIVMLGEPKRWESALQILIDLLKTDGKPNCNPQAVPETHLPVIACNMDLQFMDRACMPRFGHGAFLCCLEALYKKCTGYDLKYTSLVGKPSEITFLYAEHCITKQARKLGIKNDIEKLYVIGDTPEVDVVGGRLYERFIDRLSTRRRAGTDGETSKSSVMYDPALPESRNMPASGIETLCKQTVQDVYPILVCTGVYNPSEGTTYHDGEKHYKGHRDFPFNHELYKPSEVCLNVDEAVKYILEKEQVQDGS